MTLADGDFQAWVGRERVMTDPLPAFPARGLAALLDRPHHPQEGDPLPAAWHWVYFLETPSRAATGVDGHPLRGDFLPPIPLERRMWAAGSVSIESPLVVGVPSERVSRIAAVTLKQGGSGPLIFVSVEHRTYQDGKARLIEEQTLVYRAMPTAPEALAAKAPPPTSTWSSNVPIDPVTLFKYSALTFNGHRIHYDRPYAVAVEHYPGLVVQAPLLATLLLELVARECPGEPVSRFTFRAMSPTYDSDTLTLHGQPEAAGASLWTTNGRGVGMQATVRFGSGSAR